MIWRPILWCNVYLQQIKASENNNEMKSALDRNFTQNLKRVRHERGMSQTELAAATGISQQTISKIESGRVGTATLRTLEEISKRLGVPPTEMISAVDVADQPK